MRARSLLVALLLLEVLSSTALAADEARRPNILFCFADDWGRYASAYAAIDGRPSPNQIVKTPHIDRIAKNGVLFRNAFVNAPSCTPCRSALLSGRYFFATGRGAILRNAVWDSAIPSFPLLLKDSGYHIGETWKVWSPGVPNDAPFGAGKYAYEKAGRGFNNFSENVTQALANGASIDATKERLLGDVRGNFDAFLEARTDKAPFLYWFGPTNVHRLWQKGSGKALWGIDPESLKGKLPKNLPDVPEVREDFADYLGEVQAFDAAVGVLLKRLEETGELDNTLIVVSGDHGAPGFPGGKCNLYDFGVGVTLAAWWPGHPGGRVVDDLVNLMDLMPTFLEAGGVKPPAGIHGRSLVDVLKSDKSGQVDPARTFVVTGRERHVDSAREENRPYPQRAIRTKDFLYIRNFRPDRWPMGSPYAADDAELPKLEALETDTRLAFPDMDAGETKAWLIQHRHDPKWKWHYDYAFGKRPAEELYDCRKDPDQIQNIAADPAHAEEKAQLAKQLMQVLEASGDPRVTGDKETFEKPPFTDLEQPPAKQPPAKPKPAAGAAKPEATPSASNNRAPTRRPNILLIYTDDQSYKTVGCYPGSFPWVRTPQIDSLSKSGIQFHGAYCGAWCMPSRATMLTGRYPHGIESMRMEGDYPSATYDPKLCPFWPRVFREQGYQTAQIGKWHTGIDAGWGRDWDYQIVWNRPKLPKNAGAYYDGQILAINGEEKLVDGYSTDNYTRWACDYIRGENRDKGKPWYLWLCYGAIHGPSIPAQRHKGLYRDAEVIAPRDIFPPRPGKPAYLDVQQSWTKGPGGEPVIGKSGEKFDDGSATRPRTHAEFVRRMNECVPAIDEGVGKLLAALRESGQLDNTLVVFTADQGFGMGEHGFRTKLGPYDATFRSPLIVSMPGTIPAGRKCDKPVTAADLVVTFFHFAGIDLPWRMHGHDITPLLRDPEKAEWPHVAFFELTGDSFGSDTTKLLATGKPQAHNNVPWWVAIREGRHKYIRTLVADEVEELYDLDADPEELTNLAIDPKHQPLLERLRRECLNELRRTEAGFIEHLPPTRAAGS